MAEASEHSSSIAVIGMAGRFPGAPNLDAFWRNLAQGIESVTEFSDEEIIASGVDPAHVANPNYVKRGAFLEDAEYFDASFFGFNPREAQVIDPQQRVFLECAWEALDNAGYGGENGERSIAVYAGSSLNTYVFNNLLANREILGSVSPYQLMLATDKDYLATRVAYKLNLKGPAVTIQTACSTSLAAVQVACQNLLAKQCDMALAGGVSVLFPRRSGYLYTEGMILSPDGHCRPFDAQARGTHPGSGAGVVVLKRLDDAVREGDTIRAVIKGAAMNNDGSAKIGYTAPSVDGQTRVLQAAQAMAGVDPASITYIEAHGTATSLGDPIELAALERVFRAHTAKKQFCAIGSVKSNIGHLDAAAGVAGLIKTVLALEQETIPPTLHYQEPNPQIDFANSPFFVNDKLRPWKAEGGPRRAGVSSFGIGGTNTHVVLEEAPESPSSRPVRSNQLLVLSAKSASALQTAAGELGQHFSAHPELSLADAAYTLQMGRQRFSHRRYLVCSTPEEAIAALTNPRERAVNTTSQEAVARPVGFLFSGQGSQHINMAAGLYLHEPAFRKHFDECAELLKPHLGCDLREVLYPAAELVEESAEARRLNETWLAQPALFAVEYSLARMWMSWGIVPDACLGHSIGEYVAACLAGVFSLEDGLSLISSRGRLMQSLPRGSMLAVPLPEEEFQGLLNGSLSIAAANTYRSYTISGPEAAVSKMERELRAREVECARVPTSHAFHSSMMEPAVEAFAETVRQVRLSPPRLPFLSNLTGTWIRPEEATDPRYWALHLRNTVRFADGIRHLISHSNRILLEVGPGQTLSHFAREIIGNTGTVEVVSSLPHRRDPQSAARFALQTLGRLWAAGAPVDWAGFHREEALRRVPLPSYPFERKPYYVERQSASQPVISDIPPSGAPQADAPQKNAEIADWFYVPSWKRSVISSQPLPGSHMDQEPWLLFVDGEGLGARVQEILSASGGRFTTVRPGESFQQLADGSFTIVPGNREHYFLLLQECRRRQSVPRSVLHLWNVTGSEPQSQSRDASFYSLLYFAQAWGELEDGQPLNFIVAGNGLHAVCSSQEPVQPEKALLFGPCRVLPQEYPGVVSRCVDVGFAERDQTQIAQNLVAELSRPAVTGLAAYRMGQRWEQTFEAVRIEEQSTTPVLRQGGVYLITGGTGGIGLTLARHLAEAVQARLVLTARSPLPPSSEWEEWLSVHTPEDPVSEKIRQIQALERAGAEVMVLAADVSDAVAMRRVFEEARQRFGSFDGVIHAAGIAGGGLMQLRSPAMAERVLAPKVEGTLVLGSLLRDEKPAFLLLCSSVNALSGGVGTVDYASANAFLDAFAHSRKSSNSGLTLSVNWDTWREIGMAVNTEVPHSLRSLRQQSLDSGILPAEGVQAFQRVLQAGFPQTAVITRDLNAVMKQALRPVAAAISPQRAEPAHSPDAQSLVGNDVSPQSGDDLQRKVGEIWKELLGMQEIGSDENFFALGGHSLLATGILSRIRSSFGVNLPLRVIFESPTIRELAFVVEARLWREKVADRGSSLEDGDREEIEF